MKLRHKDNLLNYIYHMETFQIPLVLGVISVAWGIVLLSVESTFDTGTSYTIMSQLLSENAWAWVFIFNGVFHFSAAFLEQIGQYKHFLT